MDKDISWFAAHDDRLGHTRIGATDPENARALYGMNVSFSAKRPEEKSTRAIGVKIEIMFNAVSWISQRSHHSPGP